MFYFRKIQQGKILVSNKLYLPEIKILKEVFLPIRLFNTSATSNIFCRSIKFYTLGFQSVTFDLFLSNIFPFYLPASYGFTKKTSTG